jgi:cysteine synthase A
MLDHIGNTPLERLYKIGKNQVNIHAKLEYLNPSGSMKDRIALRMIEDAEKAGILNKDSLIVEASTGNTAIALAFVSAMKGYKLKIFMPAEVGEPEKLKIIKMYGADIETVDTGYKSQAKDASVHGGLIEVLPRQRCLDEERMNKHVWWARQFSNPSNPHAHEDTTGQEILKQMDGPIDALVVSIGTAGSLIGVGRALLKKFPKLKIFGVEPAGFPWIQGGKAAIKYVEEVAGGLLLTAADMVDEVIVINDQEACSMANRLLLEEGHYCGMSSGANIEACLKISQRFPELKNLVTLFPDRRDRYLTLERYTT